MEGPPLLASKGAQAYALRDVPMEGKGSYISALNWSKEQRGRLVFPWAEVGLLSESLGPFCQQQ